MNLQKIIDLRQLITFDSFFINVCKEMGPRIAHFLEFLWKRSDTCALVVTWFCSITVWSDASRSLFLNQDPMLTRWQVKKLRRKTEGQVTLWSLSFGSKD